MRERAIEGNGDLNYIEHPLSEVFGSNVFNDAIMRERLPKDVYKKLKATIEHAYELDPSIADIVASAMKDWAIEKGATHYTHWFQPLTGMTAEKHDSFIAPTSDGRVIMEFSGKELIKGEPDASSFPSGGIRSTFEARGYTAWDCTSPAFIREDAGGAILVIPTAFCSYTGEALDKKTPLLRSMDVISAQALRILKLFGNTTATRVVSTVGPEQEYFLIDAEFYKKRLDLYTAGRTLFGAPPTKGQELEDHYFGSIKERIAAFMKELNTELWKLGISAKTQHNEVAPAQYELAPIFSTTNVATDHNQITMDTMMKVAKRHGLVCLLHEKPFAGINGSGKHNNWSLSSNDGQNLLDPGKTPHANAQFLVFLVSVIAAVDKYADMLRASAATPGNDHRLGANEAPPAIISIFLGEQLTDIVEQLEKGEASSSKGGGQLKIGVSTLPSLPKDTTDRNRTSPFAFTGNKFEFRMVGSSASISGPNVVLNTTVAAVLDEVATRLEKAKDLNAEIQKILSQMIKEHKKVIFNGNNYSPDWVKEAEKRGLPNITSTVEALTYTLSDKNVGTFEKYKVFSKEEMESRFEIYLERYSKQINIEALTMIQMAKRQIMPVAVEYTTKLADSIAAVKAASGDVSVQEDTLKELSTTLVSFKNNLVKLESETAKAANIEGNTLKHAETCRDKVFTTMAKLRQDGDKIETIVPSDIWPMPTYSEMLFLSN
ncbi:MAG: glutamine synthetase III [Candidatus Margulisbacteria bacterium]|nr:glutamine synthetase III [Candidatus Margulisiibacteriota bacterium]